MYQIESLTPEQISVLDKYKCIVANKPVALTLEDLDAVKKLSKELQKAEKESESVFEEINTLNAEINERMEKIKSLEDSIDPRIKYLKSPVVQSKPVSRATNGDNPISKESTIKVLQDNPGLGNSAICEKLGVPNDKSNQNRVYTIVKQLISDNKLTEDRKVI